MVHVSPEFMTEMVKNDNRRFTYRVDVAFADGTTDTFTDEDLWQPNGVIVDDSVSSDENLDLGSTIINQCQITLQNFDGKLNRYDFTDAEVTLFIGLDIDGTVEMFQKGVYNVTEQDYDNVLLTLTCLDKMSQLDREYSESTLNFPATLGEIVFWACQDCGVALPDQTIFSFPNSDYIIYTKPTQQGITYRTVVGWAAACAGCFVRVNRFGQLEVNQYDFDLLNDFLPLLLRETDEEILRAAESGEIRSIQTDFIAFSENWTDDVGLITEDGDSLITEQGDYTIILNYDHLNLIPSLYSIKAEINDTIITGVRVCVENPDAETSADAIIEYTYGTDDYVLSIEDNGLITKDNAQDIANYVGSTVASGNAVYRKGSYSSLSNPLVEAGDVAFICDGKGNVYKTLVSTTIFSANDRQSTVSAGAKPPRILTSTPANQSVGAATPQIISGRNIKRFNEKTEEYIRTYRAMEKSGALGGLFNTEVVNPDGSSVRYLHNKMNLDDSDIRIVVSSDGIMVTANALDDEPDWYGLKVNGELIAEILRANGINANWINAGALVIYDDDYNELFRVDKTNRVFRWNMECSSLSDEGDLVIYDKNGEASIQVVASKGSAARGTTITSESVETTDGINEDGVWLNNYYLARMTPRGMSIVYHDVTLGITYTVLELTDMREGSYTTNSGMKVNGYSLEDRIRNVISTVSSSTSALSAPASLTNFSFGTTWRCNASRKNGVVELSYRFNGHFTSASTTGGTLFTLPSGYRPTNTHYINRMSQNGTAYLLSINTNGTVVLQNTSGSAGSSDEFFSDVITFLN